MKNQNKPRKQEPIVVARDKKPRPSGNHQVGGKAVGGHRSVRAKAHARSQAKASGRIVRTAGVARPRLGRISLHILRGLKL